MPSSQEDEKQNYEPTSKLSKFRKELIKLHKSMAALNIEVILCECTQEYYQVSCVSQHGHAVADCNNVDDEIAQKRRNEEREREGEKCMVCHQTFKLGDMLRTTPCMHNFHAECLDQVTIITSHNYSLLTFFVINSAHTHTHSQHIYMA